MIATAGVSGVALRNSKKILGGRVMIKKVLFCAVALLFLGGYTGTAWAADDTAATVSQTAPDHAGLTVRVRGEATPRPTDESNKKTDLNLTQQIRKAVMADK